MKWKRTLLKIIHWQAQGTNQKKLILGLSIITGVIAGLAAVVLKTLVHYMEVVVKWGFGASSSHENFLFLATPILGILLTITFLRYFIKEDIGHGISKILYAISRKKSKIKPHNMYSSIVACSLTSGFGGSVGMEAPIVFTGSSIGSNIGQFFRLNYRTITLLVGCGAAGAVSGIFKAPVTGVIFVLEVLMLDLTTVSIVPLLLASVSAAVVSHLFLGNQIVFYFSLKETFQFHNILFYIPLGILCGLLSIYLSRTNHYIEDKMKGIKSIYKKLLLGGVVLGALIFLFPPLYGEGYLSMKSILGGQQAELLANSPFFSWGNNSWLFLAFMCLLIFFKVIATAITTGAGGIGGIFAPTLFIGGAAGFAFSRFVNLFTHKFHLSESNFTLVGMAGLMAGTMHAPLTAIFLIAEITGGYELFIPLMVTAGFAYLVSKLIEPHSIYNKRLAKEGALLTHNKDKAVLTLLKLQSVIEKNYTPVHPKQPLGDLVKVVAHSKRNIFPVIDNENNFVAVVTLDSIREIMFEKERYIDTLVSDLMHPPVSQVSSDESMESVMEKFNDSGYWNLPVIDNGKYVGFVSRSNLFSAYRKLLVEFSDE